MKNKLSVLLPKGNDWNDSLFSQTILPIADECVIDFINEMSHSILTKPEFRAYPELMAMGFWMRKAHVLKILDENLKQQKKGIRLARGIVFHIAPSNVDSIFIYSWFLSMLMGNVNVIRLSSKGGGQIDLLLNLLNDLFKSTGFEEVARRQIIVKYGHDDDVTYYLSSHCDVRVIWGGDNTINKIRKIPINPTAIELPFTNKFSMSLISASEFIRLDEDIKNKLANAFINDAYWFGQMACSSPRLVVWIGSPEVVEEAKLVFWNRINHSLCQEFADISAADIINKLVVSQSIAIETEAKISRSENNLISRVQLNSISDINTDLHCGAGLFYEYSIEELDELLPLVSRKIQTVGYFGVSEDTLERFIRDYLPRGIDRFVPIGDALNFSHVWDGYNLFDEFTRVIDIL